MIHHYDPESQKQQSEFTVIRWRRHELITMACVVLCFVALFSFTLGYTVAHHA